MWLYALCGLCFGLCMWLGCRCGVACGWKACGYCIVRLACVWSVLGMAGVEIRYGPDAGVAWLAAMAAA